MSGNGYVWYVRLALLISVSRVEKSVGDFVYNSRRSGFVLTMTG